MALYSIGSLIIESDILPLSYKPFLINNIHDKKVDLHIKRVKSISYTSHQLKRVAELPSLFISKEVMTDNPHLIFEPKNGICTFQVDDNYKNIDYFCSAILSSINKSERDNIINSFLKIIIECKLVQKDILTLHSSCIEHNEIAYAFVGPSGIGKSTRAGNWCELLNANWISGDRPIIDVNRGMVFGAPWDGKEKVFRNYNCPLSVILSVKRSKTTFIKELTDKEKLQILCEQSFFPMWDTVLVMKAFAAIRRLIKTIPIYELNCDITDESTIQSINIIGQVIDYQKLKHRQNGLDF